MSTIPSRVEPRLVCQGKPRKYRPETCVTPVVVTDLPADDDPDTFERGVDRLNPGGLPRQTTTSMDRRPRTMNAVFVGTSGSSPRTAGVGTGQPSTGPLTVCLAESKRPNLSRSARTDLRHIREGTRATGDSLRAPLAARDIVR